MNSVDVFVTDYGIVRMGPMTKRYIARFITPGLQKNYRTKAHKQAKQDLRDIERAVNVMAGIYFCADDDMEATP